MTPREKITVIIPTLNEEGNLEACLEGVNWADEVFVVDSFSTDRTAEIAKASGARFVQHEYVNSATQKNWAIPQASHPWVMIVDSDERVTPELREAIEKVLVSDDAADGFEVGRENYFKGKRIRYCGWQNDTCLRLFRRDRGRYQDRHVHADVVVEGRVARLGPKLRHETFRNFDQYMRKFDRYTTWAALDRGKRTRRVTWAHLALRPAGRFFKQYILKLGILDGKAGLIICSLAAYSVFMKYAKLWEMKIDESNPKDGR